MLPGQLLTIDQINGLAVAAGYDPAALRAVLDVESDGHGFSSVTGRIIIRFEPTWFKREHKNWASDKTHTVWQNYTGESQTEQWHYFDSAYAEDATAAMLATSIGLGQIMGFHYGDLGFKDVGDMWDFAKASEAHQVDQMIRFIKTIPKLDVALKTYDWATFAYYYNGASYKELAVKMNERPYDERLAHSFSIFKAAV